VAHTSVVVTITGDGPTAVVEITTVPTVQHAEMRASYRAEMLTTTIVVASSANDVPCMSTTIAGVEYRTSEVEVVTVWIAGVDAKMPETVTPVEWAIEVAGSTECAPLPIQ